MTIQKLLENIDPQKDAKLFEETIANYIEVETEAKYADIIDLVVDKVFDEVKAELDVEQEEAVKELEHYIDVMVDAEIETLKDINLAQEKLDKAEALVSGIEDLYLEIMGDSVINEVNKRVAEELATQAIEAEEKAKEEAEKELIKEKKLMNRLIKAEKENQALTEKVASLEIDLKSHQMLTEANLSQVQSEKIKALLEGTSKDKYLAKLQMYIDGVTSVASTSLNEAQERFGSPVADKKLDEKELDSITEKSLAEFF